MSARPAVPEPVPFLGCRLHPVTTEELIEIVVRRAGAAGGDSGTSRCAGPVAQDTSSVPSAEGLQPAHNAPFTLTYLNAHTSNLSADDPEYRDVVNRCGLVYADGQAVVWAARWLGAPVPERVTAGDCILDFCRACARRGLRLYLLGGAKDLAERAAREWRERAPGLEIAGVHHGFFQPEDETRLADAIRAARPDVLLLGLSAPVQEKWMDRWANELGVPVVWCVGALFEYFGQGRPRAPRWMRRAGLEWTFRLALEPRRLWRRYLVGNCLFIKQVLDASRRR